MRTRSRGGTRVLPFTATFSTDCPEHGGFVQNSTVTIQDSVVESITDSPSRPKGRYPLKDCSHTKVVVDSYNPLNSFRWSQGDTCYSSGKPKWRKYSFSNGLLGPLGYTAGYSTGLSNWLDLQLTTMVQAVPSTTSLPNFLLELDEIPRIIPQLLSLKSALGRSFFNRSPRELVKAAANGHLLYQFGILAPLKDIKNLIGSYDAAMRRLNWLRKNNHKTVTIRRTRTQQQSVQSVTFSPYTYCLPFMESYLSVQRSGYEVLMTDVVGARVGLNYSGLNAVGAEIAAHRATMGFNKPLSILWEAVPLSWIFDYFIMVQNTLEKFTQPAFEGVSILTEPWYSKKFLTSKIKGSFLRSGNMSPWWEVQGLPHNFITYHVKGYTRSATIPSAASPPSILSGTLQGSQVTNMLAFLAQKGL